VKSCRNRRSSSSCLASVPCPGTRPPPSLRAGHRRTDPTARRLGVTPLSRCSTVGSPSQRAMTARRVITQTTPARSGSSSAAMPSTPWSARRAPVVLGPGRHYHTVGRPADRTLAMKRAHPTAGRFLRNVTRRRSRHDVGRSRHSPCGRRRDRPPIWTSLRRRSGDLVPACHELSHESSRGLSESLGERSARTSSRASAVGSLSMDSGRASVPLRIWSGCARICWRSSPTSCGRPSP